jgi:hypothetical protein
MPPQISGAYSRAVTGGGLHQELDQHCRIAEEDSDVAKELVVKPTCALTLTFYWKGDAATWNVYGTMHNLTKLLISLAPKWVMQQVLLKNNASASRAMSPHGAPCASIQ